MSDHTPANLADLLRPLWEAVPEARPSLLVTRLDRSINATMHVGRDGHWYFAYPDKDCGLIDYCSLFDDSLGNEIILARLQLAIEKRTRIFLAQDGTLATYTDDDFGESSHPDPLIARAVLLAQIVGVELGDAHA